MPAKSAANWRNRTLFHGDNLGFLRAMNSESVDLSATDPPFNKGRDFHATPDSLAKGAKFQDRWSWEKDVHQKWIDQITDDYPNLMKAIENVRYMHSDGIGAFMCFMAVRLLAMKRVLKPTGSIYLHCDAMASHYLKTIMDAIFGWENFRNEIIWYYRNGGGRAKRWLNKKHDIIFWYSKTKKEWTYNGLELGEKRTQNEGTFQGYYKTDEDGRRYQEVRANNNVYRYYVGDSKNPDDVWLMNIIAQRNKTERTGFPTQKPLELYERIIKASSNKGDIVLDPFAGCATTLVAAEKLQRKWVGIDIWEKAHDIVINRLELTTGLFGNVYYETKPPKRTDTGETDAPFLRVKQRIREPDGPKWSRTEMYEYLIEQYGIHCQECDREFDDKRYLELDHNTPRSDGGLNHISNRILLCSPCNRLKSNRFTLSGLRRENKKRGYMRG